MLHDMLTKTQSGGILAPQRARGQQRDCQAVAEHHGLFPRRVLVDSPVHLAAQPIEFVSADKPRALVFGWVAAVTNAAGNTPDPLPVLTSRAPPPNMRWAMIR
jgi:hypothetical protein